MSLDNVKIQDINEYLGLCQNFDLQLVYLKETQYICCSYLLQQMTNVEGKLKHIDQFFKQKSIQLLTQKLNQKIKVLPQIQGCTLKQIEENVCYFKIQNIFEFKQYNGYYIHEDLYILFIQWANVEKFLDYQKLFNNYLKILTLQGQTKLEEVIEQQNEQINKLHQQLDKKDADFEQFVDEHRIDKIYYMTNKSLPGLCKLGTSRDPHRRAQELDKAPRYQQKEKWECIYYITVLNGLRAEELLKNIESDRHVRLELYNDMGLDHYVTMFQLVQNIELGKNITEGIKDGTTQKIIDNIKPSPVSYAQTKQDNIQSDKMHYIQVQVKKYNLKDSEPETIKEDIVNTKDIVGLQLRINAFNFYFPELKIDLQNKIQQEKDRKVKIRTLINTHKLPKTDNPQQEIKNDIQKRIDDLQVQGTQQYLDSYSKLFPDDIEFINKIQKDIERINGFNGYLNTIFQRNKIKNRTFQGIKDTLTQERIEQIQNTAFTNYGMILV